MTFVRSVALILLASMSSSGICGNKMPALFTSASIRPNCLSILANRRLTSCSREMSACTTMAFPCADSVFVEDRFDSGPALAIVKT